MSLLLKDNSEFLQNEMVRVLIQRIKEYKKINRELVLVLVTRKGYWTYKFLEKRVKAELRKEGLEVTVISDRYVMKDFDFACIKGKDVLIFDDTVNSGNKLFFYYCLFFENGAENVYPCVYAINTEYLKKKEEHRTLNNRKYLEYQRVVRHKNLIPSRLRRETEDKYRMFEETLRYGTIFTADEIAQISAMEMKWIQDALMPFVMDLPMLVYEENREDEWGISFSESEWEKLCQKTDEWEFERISEMEQEKETVNGFFRLKDSLLAARLGNTFFDFVVKCKYRKEEGQVRAVFVPFAIVRSFIYEDVWQCFKQLLEGTSYYKEIVDYVDAEELGLDEGVLMRMNHNHNFGRALVRAVIYVVSMYIGSLFRERVELITGRRITIDKEIMKEHTVSGFIRSVEEMWNSFDSNQYRLRLMMCSKTKKVGAINIEENDWNIKEPGTDEIVGDYIQFRMINLNKPAKKVKDTILTMETIEEELDSRYYFEDDVQRKNMITKNILTLMEDSRMGNEIILDNESRVLYRGFRKGENSEVIFSRGFLWIYACAFALFYTKGVSGYLDNIGKLMRKADLWFREKNYIPNLLTESEWRFYRNYFLQMEDPHEQIQNKKGLLNSYWDGSMKAGEKAIMEEVFANVKGWLR